MTGQRYNDFVMPRTQHLKHILAILLLSCVLALGLGCLQGGLGLASQGGPAVTRGIGFVLFGAVLTYFDIIGIIRFIKD